jgi:hypothetical protein
VAVLLVEAVVGVHPEDEVTAGVVEAGVAGGGEVVAPGEVEDPGAVLEGDLFGAVGGAGIEDDDVAEEAADASRQAGRLASSFLVMMHSEGECG